MKLSIIIVNYNYKYFPLICLEYIEKSKINFPYEIIFVDNASSDESVSFLEKANREERIKLIKSAKNLGFGQGNNLGVKNAKGEFILIMNPDIFVAENTADKMVSYLEKHPEIAILGPKLVYHNGQIQESCRRFMTFSDLIIKRTFLKRFPVFKKRVGNYLMKDFDHSKICAVDFLVGACYLMRKKVFDELSGFDKRYFLFMEDVDLCQKAHLKGYKVVYFPEAEFIHSHKRLSDGSVLRLIFRKVFWHHLISSLKYFWRWRGVSTKSQASNLK